MATRTAQILLGAGHPNDDGLVDPPGVDTWWLSEGSRSIWLSGMDGPARSRRGWLPRSPNTALTDGLIAVRLGTAHEMDLEALPADTHAILARRKVDLAELDSVSYGAVAALARGRAGSFGGKLVVSIFTGSVILDQVDALRQFDVDVEVLAPIGTRLWRRWREQTVTTGILAEASP